MAARQAHEKRERLQAAACVASAFFMSTASLFMCAMEIVIPKAGGFPWGHLMAASLLGFAFCWTFASLLSARTQMFHREVDRVLFLVRHDGLTGVLNRTSFIDDMRGSEVDGHILIIDADHFKAINDNHGHYTGDKALMQLARTVQMVVGDQGLTGRLGGEEFGVFLPSISESGAMDLAEQIRRTVEREGFHANGVALGLTISIGISEHLSTDPVGPAFKRADKRLYAAKALGRNRVVQGDDLHELWRGQIATGMKAKDAVTSKAA